MSPWFDIGMVWRFLAPLLSFLPVTLGIFAGGAVLGLVAGLVLAVCRVYRLPGLSSLAWLVVSYARGVPVLVQLMIAYYILPQWLGPRAEATSGPISRRPSGLPSAAWTGASWKRRRRSA